MHNHPSAVQFGTLPSARYGNTPAYEIGERTSSASSLLVETGNTIFFNHSQAVFIMRTLS